MSSGVKLFTFLTGIFSNLFDNTYSFTSLEDRIPELTVISLFSAKTWILSKTSNLFPAGNPNVILPFEFCVILTFAAFSRVL